MDEQLVALLEGMAEGRERLEVAIDSVGLALKAEFQERRKTLKEQARQQGEVTVGKDGRIKDYAPLNITARTHKGSFELVWFEQHRIRGRNVYKPVPKGRGIEYDMGKLLRLARPYETDLVIEIERRAQQLRSLWKEIVQQRASMRRMDRICLPIPDEE